MKIFITGITGFVGQSLAEWFTTKGHSVVGYVRGSDIHSTLDYHKPELIINCAGEIYDPSLMVGTNIVMVSQILEWQKNNLSCRMIHIGSSSEYGVVDHPTSEQDRINPIDMYQATKGAGTLLCQGYAHQFGNQTCVARVYNVYGPLERPRRLSPTIHRAFFQNEPMKLYNGFHDFIFIDDFCRGLEILSESDWPVGEIVNFGTGTQYSNLEYLQVWEKVTQKTAPVEYHDTFLRAYDSKMWVCDPSYAASKYGFVAEISLEDGVREYIKRRK